MDTVYAEGTKPVTPASRSVAVPAAALIVGNVVLMYLVASTPLSALKDLLFSVPILGLLVYGAALTGGNMLVERGLEGGSMMTAALGTGLL